MKGKPLLIVIAGPTASGKTALAIDVAKQLGTEIVSADSRQIYREMNIGTAKPSAEELAAVPHHFTGTASVDEEISAGKYESACIALLEKLFAKHDAVVMVGGSGLYIEAVCSGFDELPEPPPGTRERLTALLKEKGLSHLQEMLSAADPEYFEVVDKNNPHRIIRALEICATGQKYSILRKGKNKVRNFRSLICTLDVPRETLYKRIDERVDRMMEQGLLDEVKSLTPKKHLPSLHTFGYTELFEHLEGKTTLEEAIAKIKQNTRNYAKRQVTWFKKRARSSISGSGRGSIDEVMELIKRESAL